jgi:hypothetical protein
MRWWRRHSLGLSEHWCSETRMQSNGSSVKTKLVCPRWCAAKFDASWKQDGRVPNQNSERSFNLVERKRRRAEDQLNSPCHLPLLRGISMPYARPLPRATASSVSKVPGKPKMNVTSFQNVFPVACARIPVKLRLAKIQITDAPPSVPVGLDVDCARAGEHSAAKTKASRHSARRLSFEAVMGMFTC